jgi:hypothetical protein
MTLHRIQFFVIICLLTAGVAASEIEMPVLTYMIQKSDQIYHVTILKNTGGVVDEAGLEEWTYECRVIFSFSGSLKVGDTIYFNFTARHNKDFKEKPRGEIGKEYILFLRPASESPFSVGVEVDKNGRSTKTVPSYLLVDQWLGIVPWDVNLGKDIQRLLNEAKTKQSSTNEETSK